MDTFLKGDVSPPPSLSLPCPFSPLASCLYAQARRRCRRVRASKANSKCCPLCGIPSGCCSFTGPWTVTRSSLRMLRRVATFCRPLRPVLLLVSFPRLQSPVVDVLGLCWLWRDVPFAHQRRPVVGVLRLCWLLWGLFDCFCCPHTSVPPPQNVYPPNPPA